VPQNRVACHRELLIRRTWTAAAILPEAFPARVATPDLRRTPEDEKKLAFHCAVAQRRSYERRAAASARRIAADAAWRTEIANKPPPTAADLALIKPEYTAMRDQADDKPHEARLPVFLTGPVLVADATRQRARQRPIASPAPYHSTEGALALAQRGDRRARHPAGIAWTGRAGAGGLTRGPINSGYWTGRVTK
jgi:hypothetical protein